MKLPAKFGRFGNRMRPLSGVQLAEKKCAGYRPNWPSEKVYWMRGRERLSEVFDLRVNTVFPGGAAGPTCVPRANNMCLVRR